MPLMMCWGLLVGGGLFVLVLIFVVTSTATPRTQAGLVAAAGMFTIMMLLLGRGAEPTVRPRPWPHQSPADHRGGVDHESVAERDDHRSLPSSAPDPERFSPRDRGERLDFALQNAGGCPGSRGRPGPDGMGRPSGPGAERPSRGVEERSAARRATTVRLGRLPFLEEVGLVDPLRSTDLAPHVAGSL